MKRTIYNWIIQFNIIFTILMLLLSIRWNAQQLKYFFFCNIGLGIVNGSLHYLTKTKIPVKILIFIVSAFLYTILWTHKYPQLCIFISSVLLLDVLYKKGLDKKNIITLFGGCILLSLVYILESRKSNNYFVNGDLCFGFGNPNMAGIVISNIVLVLMVMYFYCVKKTHKTIVVILILMDGLMLLKTGNRGSIFTVMIAFSLFYVYRKGNRLNELLKKILILSPVLIMLSYILLIQIVPKDLQLLGKPFFSGREIAWKVAMTQMIANPFRTLSFEEGTLNMLLVGIAGFGIFTMIIYFFILLSYRLPFYDEDHLTFQKASYISFFCVFIQQSFESTIISGSFSVYILSYLLMGIAASRQIEDGNEEI